MLPEYTNVLTPQLDQGVKCMFPDNQRIGLLLFLMNLMKPILTDNGKHHDINSSNIISTDSDLHIFRFLMTLNQLQCLLSVVCHSIQDLTIKSAL